MSISQINEHVPEEIINHIFTFLSPKALCKAKGVCKEWERLASDERLWNAFDLARLFPSLKIIDGAVWNKYAGICVDDEPTLDRYTEIKRLTKLFATLHIEGDAGITRFTLPKGLTFKILKELAKSPKEGNRTNLRISWMAVLEKLGDTPVENTRILYITNNVLKNTKGQPIKAVVNHVNGLGYRITEALPTAALSILTYISSDGETPPPYDHDFARTSDMINGYHVVIGGLNSPDLDAFIDVRGCDRIGFGAQQEAATTTSTSRSLWQRIVNFWPLKA
ncbi:MAG TPA: F-box-like domain-containing protein [Rhabdochlamydiaceae bacterium]|nr:F-box-like domain-containing protein [Rhabdochlamydiaceae bacterium]